MNSGGLGADMIELSQFVAGRSGELGVQGQYLDGELHLVDNALAGAVPAVEELKVFDSVVRSDTIDMVDGFFGEQRSPDVLGHDVAMFHNRVFFAGNETGHRDPNVSMSLDVPAVFAAVEFVQRISALVVRLARRVAILLLLVKAPAGLAALRLFFSARAAGKRVSALTGLAPPDTGTLARAVHRVSIVFLVVRGHEGFQHRKSFSAFETSEFQDGLCVGNSFVKAVRASTRKPTVFPVFAREAGKRLLAVLTDFLNRHVGVPSFGDEGILALPFGKVK